MDDEDIAQQGGKTALDATGIAMEARGIAIPRVPIFSSRS
jgi:hypothetical protein